MLTIYKITEVNHKNRRVQNIKFRVGEKLTRKTFRDLAASYSFIYENFQCKFGSVIRIFDLYDNLLIQAESLPNNKQ